jgi:IS605 OrfB family transposase
LSEVVSKKRDREQDGESYSAIFKPISDRASQASGIPRICFGSRSLFHKQFRLKANGYASQEAWRADWLEARGKAFYLAGRAREKAGNAACILEVLEVTDTALTCVLQLRKKNDEIAGRRAKPGDYIPIKVKFTYNHKYLLAALEERRPVTYRFIRKGTQWKVQAMVDCSSVPIVTHARNGSIGVDQNPLCIVTAGIKPDGNEDGIYAYKLTQGHLSAKQAEHELSHVVCEIVALAVATGRPIVIERLDFVQLQRELKSRGLNRLLSRFKHSTFRKLLYGRAAKFGVEVIEVNPAFSSIIGWQKFGHGCGFNRHQAAAIAIGRRVTRPPTGKPFSERIRVRETPGHPAARQLSRDAPTKPARKRTEHDWTGWRRLGKLLATKTRSSRAGRADAPADGRHEAGGQGAKPLSAGTSRDSHRDGRSPGWVNQSIG